MQNQLLVSSPNSTRTLDAAKKTANKPLKMKSCIRPLALVCLLAMPATAQVNYAVSGNTAYVTASPGASGDVLIASTYNGYPVTSIGDYAFQDCSGVTSVTIPNSVTSIGNWAFESCVDLTSVTIPDSITNIGSGAFFLCSSLTDVVLPDSVSTIGYDAFLGSGLETATIPDGVTSIAQSAFGQCRNLISVTIGNGVTSIGLPVFDRCSSLTNITVAALNPAYSSLNGILFNKARTTLVAFPGGRSGDYVVPNGVLTIGDYAFDLCGNLTNVTLPDGVTTIGFYAFDYCTNLASVRIPDSVTTIGTLAFADCTSLGPSVVVGNGVRTIYDYAFSGCTNLSNITFRGNSPTGADHMFYAVNAGAKVYYYAGTVGWGATYYGLPTVKLDAPVQIVAGSVGIRSGGFGFTLNGVANRTVVVEASTNLLNWEPVWTNTSSSASAGFVDQQSLNYPSRFYRARSN